MSALTAAILVTIAFMAMHKAAVSRASRERDENDPALKTLTIAQPADADTLDPSDIDSTDTLSIARLMFGTLYRVSPEGTLEPYLAESYSFAQDGKSITLKLRPEPPMRDRSALNCQGRCLFLRSRSRSGAEIHWQLHRLCFAIDRFSGHAR